MLKLAIGIALASSLLLAACGGGRAAPAEGGRGAAAPASAPTAAPRVPAGLAGPAGPAAATPAPRPAGAPESAGAAKAGALDLAQRQVISTGTVTIEVAAVPPALAQVRIIAESLGGFIEQLSSAGSPERQQATITIRVPQAQFFAALERLEALGKVQGRNLGSQDVTEQFIDLEARLQSSLRAERSLLSLLERTASVSEVLTIERELARVRAEIERLQGQLNFLKRRVELATITVALVPPQQEAVVPPSASLAVGVPDVAGSVEAIKALVAGLGGVVDRASLSVKDGKETARLSLRVFGAQFDQALRSLEGQGKVSSKEVQEGKAPKDGEAARPKEPDARIEVSLAEKKPRWPAVVALIAVVVVVGGFAFGGYVTGRYWARRSGTAS